MDITTAGGALGIPGLYVTGDPGGIDDAAKKGALSLSLGTGWAKSLSFTTGQCPVMKYNRGLMMAILHDRVHIAKNVNAKPITLEDAPRGYAEFDAGAAQKYVLNPNGYLKASQKQTQYTPEQRPGTARQELREGHAVPAACPHRKHHPGNGQPCLHKEIVVERAECPRFADQRKACPDMGRSPANGVRLRRSPRRR